MQTSKILAFALVGLLGCAASNKAATTSTTAADVSSSPSSEEAQPAASAPEARESTPKADKAEESLPGQLVCRTTNRDTGTTELRLEWEGSRATGTLRTVAPSGEITTQRIKAERYRGMIIVDEPGQEDLVVHAAIIAPASGKQAMRVGSGMYTTCE